MRDSSWRRKILSYQQEIANLKVLSKFRFVLPVIHWRFQKSVLGSQKTQFFFTLWFAWYQSTQTTVSCATMDMGGVDEMTTNHFRLAPMWDQLCHVFDRLWFWKVMAEGSINLIIQSQEFGENLNLWIYVFLWVWKRPEQVISNFIFLWFGYDSHICFFCFMFFFLMIWI